MNSFITREILCKYLIDHTLPEAFTNNDYHSLLRVLIHAQLHGYIAYKDISFASYPLAFRRHLQSITTFSKAQYVQVVRACRRINEDLAELNAPVILLKGAAYIAANKANSKGRLISDVDILVAKKDLPKVESLLLAKGWVAKELDDFDEKYYREWSHELPPYTHIESGVTLDIHHNLLPGTSGKTIDIANIIATKQSTEYGLFVPKDDYLILHSAIHLLLNDDIEKGLRDCLDLHYLVQQHSLTHSLNELKDIFVQAGCEDEFYILLMLLQRLFKEHATAYTKPILSEVKHAKFNAIVSDLEKAVFPSCQYLYDSNNSLARFRVYLRGHLSKMPLPLFLKHLVFKTYRTIVKKLLGEYFFKKEKKLN